MYLKVCPKLKAMVYKLNCEKDACRSVFLSDMHLLNNKDDVNFFQIQVIWEHMHAFCCMISF